MYLIILPFIAAVIGYVTNYIAVKMLFHPRTEKKILFLKIQGVFPRRQAVLARRLGVIVAEELFSMSDIREKLNDSAFTEGAEKLVREKVKQFLSAGLAESFPMFAMFLNPELLLRIENLMMREITAVIPEIKTSFTAHLEKNINIEAIVQEKVTRFSSDRFEQLLYAIMKKEFRFIEIIGGVLGFFIGCIQVILVRLLPNFF